MAALLVAMSVLAVFMTIALPVWNTQAQREKEAELVFRGEQYARAVMLYQRKFANALPPSVDVLLNDRYLRKKYKDPITGGRLPAALGASAQANAGVAGGTGGRAARPGGRWCHGARREPPDDRNHWNDRRHGHHGDIERVWPLEARRRPPAWVPERAAVAGSGSGWRRRRRRRHGARRHHGGHQHEQREVAAPLQRPRRLQRVDVRAGVSGISCRCGARKAPTPLGGGRGGRGAPNAGPRRRLPCVRAAAPGGPGSSPFRPPAGTFGSPQTQPGGRR
jgi:type II secretory pathway pseudopilin PulG